jgi:glycosyltransferase involved in cell wall biosynthesis
MTAMKIAHVIDSMELGGAEAVVLLLARRQMQAGHSVEVHCLIKKGPLADKLEEEGVRIWLHGPSSRLRESWRLYRAFKRSRLDVVHCHNKAATVRAAGAARLAGVGAVLTTRHGMAALPYRIRKDLKFWVVAALFCDRVVAVCETARRNMIRGARRAAHKVVTIRNGADAPTSFEKPITAAGFTLLTVGRHAAAKNYPVLLRAIALARLHVPDLRLWMVGDGPETPTLKTLATDLRIAEIVQFWGERTDVGRFLQSADVFVLSSISEGLPISILEAMAAGLPIIATDVGGMPEVLGLCRAGTIVPTNSAERMASAIVQCAADREALSEMGRTARSCYERHFDPQMMADEYVALYRTCARSHRALSHAS